MTDHRDEKDGTEVCPCSDPGYTHDASIHRRSGPEAAGGGLPATFSEFTEAMATAEEAYVAVIAARVEAFSRCTDILCGEVARGCAETGPCCKNCCHPPLVTPPADPKEASDG